MTDAFHNYYEGLQARLLQHGYAVAGEQFPFKRLSDIDRALRFVRVRTDGTQFLVTRGCAPHTRNSKFKSEFIIATEEPQKYFVDLINFAAYFHLTYRDILMTDVLEIGSTFDVTRDYSHIYASMPYFLPPEINSIEVGTVTCCLTWLMPIRHFEAEYIAKHGADAFEAKLEHFALDFFADRSDPSYLD